MCLFPVDEGRALRLVITSGFIFGLVQRIIMMEEMTIPILVRLWG
jgi:hypothetical protein